MYVQSYGKPSDYTNEKWRVRRLDLRMFVEITNFALSKYTYIFIMKANFYRIILLLFVSVFAISAFAQDDDTDNWRSKMPVRRLHKKPAVIVVDSTDNTTYYLQPQDEEKPAKLSKRQLQEEKERQARITRYLKQRAQDDPEFEEEMKARKARREAAQAKLDSLLAIDYSLDKLQWGPQPLEWVDEKIKESKKELSKTLRVSSDRVIPKDVKMEVTNNDMFFYFDIEDGKPQPLRFHAQYYADDPLQIESVRFVVNGFGYDFTPVNLPKTGKHGSRFYWETLDEELTVADKDLVYALSHATWARVVFIGARGFSHVKKFTEDQIKDFYAVYALYLKMGGKF